MVDWVDLLKIDERSAHNPTDIFLVRINWLLGIS